MRYGLSYSDVMEQTNAQLIEDCVLIAQQHGTESQPVPAGPDGLSVVRARHPSQIRLTLYHPMICLVLQGAKEIQHRNGAVGFAAGETALVSHELVTGARITQATPDRPYVALACRIDPEILRGLQAEMEPGTIDAARGEAVAAGTAEQGVVDAMTRLFRLRDRPLEERILGPMIRRELHFRVLLSRHGSMMRQLSQPGSPASRIARAISHIRQHWDAPLRTQDLAAVAGMSASSFHEHFKAITATSPIQYQKALRLALARERLVDGEETVSPIAYAVGYESPTQFSRDFRRAYGVPPKDSRAVPL